MIKKNINIEIYDDFNLIEKEGLEIVVGCRDKLPRISEEIFSFYSSLKYGIRDEHNGKNTFNTYIRWFDLGEIRNTQPHRICQRQDDRVYNECGTSI